MNALKKDAHITKCGISFAKLIESTTKLPSDMKNSEEPSDNLLQFLLSISTNTIEEIFYHIGGKIGELSDQNKRTVAAEIVRKWGQSIVGSGACVL